MRAISETPHDAADDAIVLFAIDACNTETDAHGKNGAITNRVFNNGVEHLFDFKLAVRLEVRTTATPFTDDATVDVGEITHRFGTTGIDAEDVHAVKLMLDCRFRCSPGASALPPCARCVLRPRSRVPWTGTLPYRRARHLKCARCGSRAAR